MSEKYIYLDYAANTPVDKEVLDTFCDTTLKYFANPTSTHPLGKIVNEKISVRNAEELTNQETHTHEIKKTPREKSNNEYKYVEDLLREKLDAKVKIKDKKIVINFTSTADLNRILEIIDIKE